VNEREKVEGGAAGNGRIGQIIDKYRGDSSGLIQVLLEIQSEHHWLPKEALEEVSGKLEVPLNQIQHIATFYKAFSLLPRGRHEIQVCMGTACHIRGAPRILDTVENLLGIHPSETDVDLKFSLETVNCLGCCAMGPVMVVDGKYHGKTAPANVEKVLKSYD
jgi:NADH-quinone oxidoreductase subunit E